MSDDALFRRNAAALALIAAPVLAVASRFVYRPTGGNQPTKLLTALHDAHGRALFGTVLFIASGLPFAVAALGIGHLLRGRFPTLSSIGAGLAVVGAFCDSIASAFTIVYTQMAQDLANKTAYAAVIKKASRVEGLFSILGILGTVIGLLLLSIGLFRSRIGHRWVGPLLWAFLLLEFIGSGISASIGLASVTLALIAYCALAATVRQSPRAQWAISDDKPEQLSVDHKVTATR
jgi:hypothetical protein